MSTVVSVLTLESILLRRISPQSLKVAGKQASMPAPPSSVSSGSLTLSVMLAIHEKKTSVLDLYRPLCAHVALRYSEREAQNLEDDLQDVRQMRIDLERASDVAPLDARRDLLIAYFRFPISADRNHINNLSFNWYDTFLQNRKASQPNIHLEKAANLFNLAAVYSQIGLYMDRNSMDDLKLTCNRFQLAAGTFAFLRDNESVKASIGRHHASLPRFQGSLTATASLAAAVLFCGDAWPYSTEVVI